jgi:hypothetical protein
MVIMTSKNRKRLTSKAGRRETLVAAVFISLFAASSTTRATDFLAEFDGPEASWKVMLPPQGLSLIRHVRERDSGRSGGSEYVRISSTRENSLVRLEHPVPAATVLDELEISLWVKSNHEGFELIAKVNLPDIVDPETHAPVSIVITGDKYATANQWQQLKCRTTDRAVNERLRVLRANKQISVTPKVMYVERVALKGQIPPGETQFHLDNLVLSPLVRYQSNASVNESAVNTVANRSGGDVDSVNPRSVPPVQFEGHRFYVDNKLFFPRIVTGQGERPEVFTAAGMNVVFVQDYENTSVTAPLRRQGLWLTSIPPYARGADGDPLDEEDANLLPFQADTSAVLFWILGTRMTTDGRPRITSWANQVRSADRRYHKRPIAADVIEGERLVSRHVDCLGISKHVINSGYSLKEYRDGLIQRRDQAWPDTFIWTWIQTEPAPTLLDLARHTESPPIIEPEQIRLQVYAALAAGCRGIGYWTTTPLDHDSPAARERLLTLTQLNSELELFEPWITSGGTPQLISFNVDASRSEQQAAAKAAAEAAAKASPRIGYHTPGVKPVPPKPATKTTVKNLRREFQAALFRSDRGYLLLPTWLDDTSQFVPGPMGAHNVSIIVPGAGETAAAWEISTTGKLRHLAREQALGGVKIKLPRFDQTAAILITSNPTIVDELNQKILSIQEQSANICVELARLKLERIRQLHLSLPSDAIQHPEDARGSLGAAKLQLDDAQSELNKQEYARAGIAAAEALEYGRFVQLADWEQAVRRLPNITKSPWALSFQSLPEHYRLMKQLENQKSLNALSNLLPSGEFENMGTLVAERWRPEQSTIEAVDSSAGLYGVAKQGENCLRLSASLNPNAGDTQPKVFSKPLVTVVSPGISVHAGQIVRISGWAKIPQAISGSFDGALIYDSLLGKPGAVRLKAAQDWQRFELVRPVPESQELTITLSLQGIGELYVDDLRVIAFEPAQDITLPSGKSDLAPAKHSTFESIRRLNPLPMRK